MPLEECTQQSSKAKQILIKAISTFHTFIHKLYSGPAFVSKGTLYTAVVFFVYTGLITFKYISSDNFNNFIRQATAGGLLLYAVSMTFKSEIKYVRSVG